MYQKFVNFQLNVTDKKGMRLLFLSILLFASGCEFFAGMKAKSVSGAIDASSVWSGIKFLGSSNQYTDNGTMARHTDGSVYHVVGSDANVNGLTVIGSWDMYIVKYSNDGSVVYTKQLGMAGKQLVPKDMVIDSSGNFYILGSTDAPINGEPIVGTLDTFVAKYSADGVLQWFQVLNSATRGYPYGIALAPDDDVVITGLTIGNYDGVGAIGFADIFVSRLDSLTGTTDWSKVYGQAATSTQGYGVVFTSGGELFISGKAQNNLNGQATTAAVSGSLFLMKLNPANGNEVFTKLYNGDAGSSMFSGNLIQNAGGNLVVVGYTNANTLYTASKIGNNDFFIFELDLTGAIVAVNMFGAAAGNISEPWIDNSGDGGYFVSGPTNVGLFGNSQNGDTDLFTVKLNSGYSVVWAHQVGGTFSGTYFARVIKGANGEAFSSASTYDSLPGYTLLGWADAYLIRFQSDGTPY